MYTAYRFAVFYFALFGVLLLSSGTWLFLSKIGFSSDAVTLYYLGSDIVPGKSAYGLLETAVPHLGAMGLFIMVSAHFIVFAPAQAKRRVAKVVPAVFAAALFDIFSGFFITAGASVWVWIKLLSFTVLMLLGTVLSATVLYYAFWHSSSPLQHPR